MKTVQNIIMNGRKKEQKKIFTEAGCPELLKFMYCPSDGRYKLRIPVSIKNKYDLKPTYKARSMTLTTSTAPVKASISPSPEQTR